MAMIPLLTFIKYQRNFSEDNKTAVENIMHNSFIFMVNPKFFELSSEQALLNQKLEMYIDCRDSAGRRAKRKVFQNYTQKQGLYRHYKLGINTPIIKNKTHQ